MFDPQIEITCRCPASFCRSSAQQLRPPFVPWHCARVTGTQPRTSDISYNYRTFEPINMQRCRRRQDQVSALQRIPPPSQVKPWPSTASPFRPVLNFPRTLKSIIPTFVLIVCIRTWEVRPVVYTPCVRCGSQLRSTIDTVLQAGGIPNATVM